MVEGTFIPGSRSQGESVMSRSVPPERRGQAWVVCPFGSVEVEAALCRAVSGTPCVLQVGVHDELGEPGPLGVGAALVLDRSPRSCSADLVVLSHSSFAFFPLLDGLEHPLGGPVTLGPAELYTPGFRPGLSVLDQSLDVLAGDLSELAGSDQSDVLPDQVSFLSSLGEGSVVGFVRTLLGTSPVAPTDFIGSMVRAEGNALLTRVVSRSNMRLVRMVFRVVREVGRDLDEITDLYADPFVGHRAPDAPGLAGHTVVRAVSTSGLSLRLFVVLVVTVVIVVIVAGLVVSSAGSARQGTWGAEYLPPFIYSTV